MWASDGLNALRRSGEDELLMSVLLGLSVRSQKAGEYHGLMIQPNGRPRRESVGCAEDLRDRPVRSVSDSQAALWMPKTTTTCNFAKFIFAQITVTVATVTSI